MGLYAGYWAVTVTGIKHGQMWILTRASMSCDDATGLLKWSPRRLAEACRVTVRSLETHLPRLAKLELMKHADEGFRVVGWVASEKFSENFSERKNERKKEPKKESKKESNSEIWSFLISNHTQETGIRETQEFTFAVCSMCEPSHEFAVDLSYFAFAPKRFACPVFVAKYNPAGVSR